MDLIKSVLVVCIGNICRSPVGERVLQAELPDMIIASAGLGALIGYRADSIATAVAKKNGIDLEGHEAQQFTSALGVKSDLILVMEPNHRLEIGRIAPQLLGKTMLFDHWVGGQGIADPYRESHGFHEQTFKKIAVAGIAWAKQLKKD